MTLKLTSTAFREGQPVPSHYTADGDDVSPPLAWSDPPDGTRALALIADDPDAPRGTWVHWVLYNLPGGAKGLDEGLVASGELPCGARQGKNDFGKVGYGGPAPPRGKPHHYVFKLYALDAALELPPGATKDQLLSAMRDHTLDEGRLTGTYQR